MILYYKSPFTVNSCWVYPMPAITLYFFHINKKLPIGEPMRSFSVVIILPLRIVSAYRSLEDEVSVINGPHIAEDAE